MQVGSYQSGVNAAVTKQLQMIREVSAAQIEQFHSMPDVVQTARTIRNPYLVVAAVNDIRSDPRLLGAFACALPGPRLDASIARHPKTHVATLLMLLLRRCDSPVLRHTLLTHPNCDAHVLRELALTARTEADRFALIGHSKLSNDAKAFLASTSSDPIERIALLVTSDGDQAVLDAVAYSERHDSMLPPGLTPPPPAGKS